MSAETDIHPNKLPGPGLDRAASASEQHRLDSQMGPVRNEREFRVLVVDNDADAATSLCGVLRALGCKTAEAHSGMECLEIAFSFDPHLSFIDLEMPGMSGDQVVRKLRAAESPLHGKLICLTGHGRVDDRWRCLSAGFDDLVTKPMAFRTLVSALADLRDG